MNLLSRLNPVTRVLALLIVGTPLLLSVDAVSAGVSLAFSLLLAPVCGVGWGTLARRSLPILLATPIAGASMALYGRPEGREYFSFLFAHVTDNSLSLALAIMVRVLAVGLPAVILLAGIDPTELGDGLSQILRLPHRFVIGAVAAARMVSLLRSDWQSMRRSRRARGLDGRGRIATALSMTFGLLVLALRRGAKLATAMEARGFGRYPTRTFARPSRWRGVDWAFLLACALISACAVSVAVATGSFRFLGA
ncbi:energy-coupling factor transporter transmembrane component T family protein [Corynebacterium vitaeruminis]|uniref:energy-coupling factor transporter transmembrane component T family protein n=2 Tax=Corynebacterium vitaeruminis TaxID=38305 RepID=UPI00054D7E44|nr:energy-coupling factor transporter transmembrane component T [Corynebacterium vitaeruminis]